MRLGAGVRDVSLGDVDGDGDLDLFVARNEQGMQVWINTGNGDLNFAGQRFPADEGSQTRRAAIGDLDGPNGLQDVAPDPALDGSAFKVSSEQVDTLVLTGDA